MASDCIKILAIEDDEFMRIFLKDVFAVHGGELSSEFYLASTIDKGRELLEQVKPDLIFLDMALPQKQGDKPDREAGLKFLEEVKKGKQKIKIVVFSGFNDSELSKKAMALGADKYMVKGEYLPRDLIQAVAGLFSGKKAGK